MENAGGNFDGMPSTLLRNLSGIIDGAIAVKRHGGNIGKFSREVQTAIDEWHNSQSPRGEPTRHHSTDHPHTNPDK